MTADLLDYSEFVAFEFECPLVEQLYYHLTNQTSAGESPEFPVVTDAILCDLQVMQFYADGSCSAIPLYDMDGIQLDELDCRTVYLDSLDTPSVMIEPITRIVLSGTIEPTILEVQTECNGPVRIVRVKPDFKVEISRPGPGEFTTICATDRDGNDYPIGTFGIALAP
jgi:hypothetical protein